MRAARKAGRRFPLRFFFFLYFHSFSCVYLHYDFCRGLSIFILPKIISSYIYTYIVVDSSPSRFREEFVRSLAQSCVQSNLAKDLSRDFSSRLLARPRRRRPRLVPRLGQLCADTNNSRTEEFARTCERARKIRSYFFRFFLHSSFSRCEIKRYRRRLAGDR